MTQENILVSPRLSACLKPGSLFRFVANPGASPGLRPSNLGDTRAHVAQISQSARPTLSTLCAHAGATPNRASALECGSLYRFSTAPVTSLTVTPPRRFPCPLPIAHCPLPIAHRPSPIAHRPETKPALRHFRVFRASNLGDFLLPRIASRHAFHPRGTASVPRTRIFFQHATMNQK